MNNSNRKTHHPIDDVVMMELRPFSSSSNPARSHSASETYWSSVFHHLARSTNDVESGPLVKKAEGISLKELKACLDKSTSYELEKETGLPRHRLLYIASQLESYADKNKDGKISLQEWNEWVEAQKKKQQPFQKHKSMAGFMQVVAYSPTYSCCPPTVFILGISLLEVLFYLLCHFTPDFMGIVNDYGEPSWLMCSDFIYNPHRRREAWRLLTYMFLHGSHQHIGSNVAMQLIVGIPLEMSQPGWLGSLRVASLYLAGVIIGGLGASVVEPTKYLVGASAGVYALISAHLATLILNWKEDGEIYSKRVSEGESAMNLNPWIRGLRLAFVILFAAFDIGLALYNHYYLGLDSTTSYAGHGFGAFAGLLIGVFAMKNRKVEDWEVIVQWICFGLFGLILCIFILWHIIGTNFAYFPTEYWDFTPLICTESTNSTS